MRSRSLYSLAFELIDGTQGHYDRNWGGKGQVAICDDFSRLYYLDSGRGRVNINNNDVVLKPGRLYLFPCGRRAFYECTKPMQLNWVHFRIEYLPGMDVFARGDVPMQVKTPDCGKDFQRIIKGCEPKRPEDYFRGVRSLTKLLKPFLPGSWDEITPPAGDAEKLMPAVDYIKAHAEDGKVTLKQLARQVHLHPTYFSNLFKEVFGRTPIQYLTETRLRKARVLLLSSDLTIAQIADSCGYNDPFYFTRIFKKNTGMNPREFRNSSGIFERRPNPASY